MEQSRLISFLRVSAEILLTGLIWLFLSLPLITAGAAFSAAYRSICVNVRGGRGYIHKEIFSYFMDNLKQSTIIWLMYLALLIISGADMYILKTFVAGSFPAFLQVLLMLIVAAAGCVAVYALSYTAMFEARPLVVLKNSFFLCFKAFPRSILICFVLAGAAMLLRAVPVLLLILPGPIILLLSYILEPVYDEQRRRAGGEGPVA